MVIIVGLNRDVNTKIYIDIPIKVSMMWIRQALFGGYRTNACPKKISRKGYIPTKKKGHVTWNGRRYPQTYYKVENQIKKF